MRNSSRVTTLLSICLLCLIVNTVFSQTERIYLQLSKYVAAPKDTIWLKGYLLKNQLIGTATSTNLYTELVSEHGEILKKEMFPIFKGLSIGQIVIPDSLLSGNYYLRAYTRYQLNDDSTHLFAIPILVYNSQKPAPVNYKRESHNPNAVVVGLLDGINWMSRVHNGKISSMLLLNTIPSQPRHLQVLQHIQKDSIQVANITLSATISQSSVSFIADTSKTEETLYLYEDSTLIARQIIRTKDDPIPVQLITDTTDLSPGGHNAWQLQLPGTLPYFTSISVTDADKTASPPITIATLNDSYTENYNIPIHQADTGYITLTGTATKESGRKLKDQSTREIVAAGIKDSSFLFTKVMKLDSLGRFRLDSLFFFNNIDLHFQINEPEGSNSKNVALLLNRFVPPAVDTMALLENWEDDIQQLPDTTSIRKPNRAYIADAHMLKAVTVKSWKSPRKELDERYTSGAFSEPTAYSFDIRTERKYHDIGSYLRMNFPRFLGGFNPIDTPHDAMGHPMLFYVNEQLYTWAELDMFSWDKIAYIKCFESDFIGDDPFTKWLTGVGGFTLTKTSSTPGNKKDPPPLGVPEQKTTLIIAIYLRQGTDFRTMPGGLNTLPIKGYSEIYPFHQDRTTLYWDAFGYGNQFHIRFNNNASCKRFRVQIEGISAAGNILHYETIIGPQ